MIYTDLTKKALRICFDAHKDQVDKSGMPYVFHPFHLAEQMDAEDAICVALLHDVVEDTETTLQNLRNSGFPEHVLAAVACMTHGPGEPYADYIARVKGNELARMVKLADLAHNSDLSRLDCVTQRDLDRAKRYAWAAAYLKDEWREV